MLGTKEMSQIETTSYKYIYNSTASQLPHKKTNQKPQN